MGWRLAQRQRHASSHLRWIRYRRNDDLVADGQRTFTLNSVDMTISWYDWNPSEIITVNGNPITLMQGHQTYNLNLSGVGSVTFSDLPSGSGYWLMDNVAYNSTPEPETVALLGSGALGVLVMPRRKRL